jgi:hypothetical protein
MNEGKIERLKQALEKKEYLKLIFVYPDTKPIFRKGYIISVKEDSFEFQDRYTGHMTLSYTFLETIESGGGEE